MASSPAERHGDVLPEWRAAVEELLSSSWQRVLVIGPADAGKSTFCRQFLGAAQTAGRPSFLLDTDVGQKIVGPPACVTVGRQTPQSILACRRFCFVGTTSPLAGWRRLADCINRLLNHSPKGISLVNTSGLLAGPGHRLKDMKFGLVRPDRIVAIGEDRELDAILARHAEAAVHRLASPPGRRRKTQAERRAARRAAFQSYFVGSRTWTVAAANLAMEGGPPERLPPARLLVGLAHSDGRDLALAIVENSDPAARTLRLLSPMRPSSGMRLKWGRMLLGEDYSETASRPADAL